MPPMAGCALTAERGVQGLNIRGSHELSAGGLVVYGISHIHGFNHLRSTDRGVRIGWHETATLRVRYSIKVQQAGGADLAKHFALGSGIRRIADVPLWSAIMLRHNFAHVVPGNWSHVAK